MYLMDCGDVFYLYLARYYDANDFDFFVEFRFNFRFSFMYRGLHQFVLERIFGVTA